MKEGLWVVPCLAPLAWWPSFGFPDRQQHWKEVLLNWGDLGTWDSISLWSSAHANQLCNSNFFFSVCIFLCIHLCLSILLLGQVYFSLPGCCTLLTRPLS